MKNNAEEKYNKSKPYNIRHKPNEKNTVPSNKK